MTYIGGGVDLPERFRIARPGSRTPVEVFIKHDEPLISKVRVLTYYLILYLIFGTNGLSNILYTCLCIYLQGDDIDVLFDSTMPVVVSFVAPLWIINSTRMMLEAAVVPISPANSSTVRCVFYRSFYNWSRLYITAS